MKIQLATTLILLSALLALTGCDGALVEVESDRKVGALGSVTNLGASTAYGGGFGASESMGPNGLGASPWGAGATSADCIPACEALFQCLPGEADDLDDCLVGCAAAIDGGDVDAASSIRCVAQAPTCAAAAQCLLDAYGDSGVGEVGNGLGESPGDGVEEGSDDETSSPVAALDHARNSGDSNAADESPTDTSGPAPVNIDCEGACDRMHDCFGDMPMTKAECVTNCAEAESLGDPNEAYRCIEAALACQDFTSCSILNI